MDRTPRPIKVYVSVDVAFDDSGRMRPRVIHWEDGGRYKIDKVLDVRPAPAVRAGGQGDRYTAHARRRAAVFIVAVTLKRLLVQYFSIQVYLRVQFRHVCLGRLCHLYQLLLGLICLGLYVR